MGEFQRLPNRAERLDHRARRSAENCTWATIPEDGSVIVIETPAGERIEIPMQATPAQLDECRRRILEDVLLTADVGKWLTVLLTCGSKAAETLAAETRGGFLEVGIFVPPLNEEMTFDRHHETIRAWMQSILLRCDEIDMWQLVPTFASSCMRNWLSKSQQMGFLFRSIGMLSSTSRH